MKRLRTTSVRWRLPALILALLASIGTAFAWSAHREVYRALKQEGDQRIHAASAQLAELLSQAAAVRVTECRRLASDEVLRRFVATGESPEAAMAVLTAFGEKNPTAHVVLSVPGIEAARLEARTVTIEQSPTPTGSKDIAEGVGALTMSGDRIIYRTRAIVTPLNGSQNAGALSIDRNLTSSSGGAGLTLIQRLMGSGAAVKLGNAGGDLWTDFAARVDAPPVSAPRGATESYVDRAGVRRLGSAVAIANTPWLVWVDFNEAELFEPAVTLLRRMLPVALILSALGTFAVYASTARMTRPLERVTRAAEAIAAGNYSERVAVERTDEIGRLATAFNTMADRVAASHELLESRVRARTQDLSAINRELEAFSYSVSHDLRAPLRSIDGFSQALLEDCADRLGADGQDHLQRIRRAAQHMGQLIDDLLKLARVTRTEVQLEAIDLSAMATSVVGTLQMANPGRTIDCRVQPGLRAIADPRLLHIALTNLLENAWKFTSKQDAARVEFGAHQNGGGMVYYVTDNGAGFDMTYAAKLFGTFQRLHNPTEFPGTGIGLATVQRIIARHGGRIWAEAKPREGATFSFTLQPEAHA